MAKTRSKHQKDLYTAYAREQRWMKNRRIKLERALKRNPENLQIVEALKNIKYRRKTPGTSLLSTSVKNAKHLAKEVKKQTPESKLPKPNTKRLFSLGTRAHNVLGELIWPNY
jgi:hypothetical protein